MIIEQRASESELITGIGEGQIELHAEGNLRELEVDEDGQAMRASRREAEAWLPSNEGELALRSARSFHSTDRFSSAYAGDDQRRRKLWSDGLNRGERERDSSP